MIFHVNQIGDIHINFLVNIVYINMILIWYTFSQACELFEMLTIIIGRLYILKHFVYQIAKYQVIFRNKGLFNIYIWFAMQVSIKHIFLSHHKRGYKLPSLARQAADQWYGQN